MPSEHKTEPIDSKIEILEQIARDKQRRHSTQIDVLNATVEAQRIVLKEYEARLRMSTQEINRLNAEIEKLRKLAYLTIPIPKLFRKRKKNHEAKSSLD